MKPSILTKSWDVLKKSGSEFVSDDCPKLGASLSYYTIFSLPPLLIIIISVCGFFFGPDAVRGEIYGQINNLVGKESALQIQDMIKNAALSNNNVFATIVGIVSLVLGASGVFSEVQDSVNKIWGLKAKPNRGIWRLIINRLISFSMVVVMGFLLLVSLILNAVVDVFSSHIQKILPNLSTVIVYVINNLVVIAITTSLFTVIFRTLPDGKVRWKDAIIGSLFTTILFILGKLAIGAYLGNSDIASAYGAAGSLIIILLWVYYSSMILYFGAEFTKVYAYSYGGKIIPNDYAVYSKTKEVEKEKIEKSEEPKADSAKKKSA